MVIYLVILIFAIIIGTSTIIIEHKKNHYLKTTKWYIRNILFFRLKKEALENAHLDNDSIKTKLSSTIEGFLKNEPNLKYKISINSNNGRKFITINITNGIKRPLYSINESSIFSLAN